MTYQKVYVYMYEVLVHRKDWFTQFSQARELPKPLNIFVSSHLKVYL